MLSDLRFCENGAYGGGGNYVCVYVCMSDAVRRNPETSRATDNNIEDEMKMWLKFAKDRDGGRRLRYEKAMQNA